MDYYPHLLLLGMISEWENTFRDFCFKKEGFTIKDFSGIIMDEGDSKGSNL